MAWSGVANQAMNIFVTDKSNSSFRPPQGIVKLEKPMFLHHCYYSQYKGTSKFHLKNLSNLDVQIEKCSKFLQRTDQNYDNHFIRSQIQAERDKVHSF